jgi:hypothetical protein
MVRLQVLDLKDGTIDLPKAMPPKQITKQNYYYKNTHTHTHRVEVAPKSIHPLLVLCFQHSQKETN